ncbi:Ig-like domain-containing protein [Mycoplana dimorpha]|uniref:Uncharacterized protein n=1 Tax=Mycoplana dimorpha TaxID=28320 RepID=A0A2T5BFJ1_MYCDI|nr:Ig-like domain-containing protein [Mycoplana dimorpha]PTM97653.1 hypothetical protein C7449_102530 [Mycoplana dimorpha]
MTVNAQSGLFLLKLLAWLGSAAALLLLFYMQFAPALVHLTPVDGSRDVHPGRAFKVRIGNAAAVRHINVSLRNDAGDILPVTFDIDQTAKLITIEPVSMLEPSRAYTLCLSHLSETAWLRRMLGDGPTSVSCASFTTRAAPAPRPPKAGAVVLVVAGQHSALASYYDEILKAEGLNLFDSVPEEHFDPESIGRYGTIILAGAVLPPAQVQRLQDWTTNGGSLVAIQPSDDLLAMLCLSRTGKSVSKAYLRANAQVEAVRSFTHPLQIHGRIDLVGPRADCGTGTSGGGSSPLGGDTVAVAGLYETPFKPFPAPAIATRSWGRGTITGYFFDLAASVAHTRQGNPDWADQDRDGLAPRRPNDLFYPDYLDLDLIGVPQADEQQRLFANIILSKSHIPLPRLWYLPGNRRVVLIMVSDDHATSNGTASFFAKLSRRSDPNCRLERWECLRATSLMTPATHVAPDLVRTYHDQGFEFGVHVDTNCKNQDPAKLANTIRRQMDEFRDKYPFLEPQRTQRLHCIVWNGWTEAARVQQDEGIRFDMNYYSWPPGWLHGRPGFMTGSGLPMPFVTEDGSVLGIYQAATQLVNENKVPQREGVRTMIEAATGPDQFVSALVTHYDFSDDYGDILIDEAERHGVALISAAQMLTWLDGRNASGFTEINWHEGVLSFTQNVAPGAEEAHISLPLHSAAGRLVSLNCAGQALRFDEVDIKGLPVASFPARAGRCEATYGNAAQLGWIPN